MVNDRMRIGVIGLGRIGAFHTRTLHGLGVDLLVTDPVPGVADAVAESTGAAVFTGADQLLAARPDGVVIASPTPTHLPLTLAAVRAGIPAFCEKPAVQDPHAAAALLSLVETTGAAVQVGFPRRFDASFRLVKAEADAGKLGRLTVVRSTTMDPAPPPIAYIRSSGGIFRDCAIHDLDAVRWLVGHDVAEVYATGTAAGEADIREAGDVDSASVLLTFTNGTLGVIACARRNGRGHDVRLEAHGELDSMAAGLDDGLPMRPAVPVGGFPAGPPHTFFMDRFADAFTGELTAFTEVVAGAPSPCSLREGLEASWLAEACALSLAEHRPVARTEFPA